MKKYFFIAFVISVLGFSSLFFYYKFDAAMLGRLSFYLSLANPYVRVVKIPEGLRREQIAEVMGNKLEWDAAKKQKFLNSVKVEGYYFPKTYLIYKGAEPEAVGATMESELRTELGKIKKPKSSNIINEETALKVASLIQREAAGKHDMNLISGIIWNRIYKGMRLQIDATLQYAKGNEEEGWWQQVSAEDKKIRSSYNTYMHDGLPPSAIANPGIDAIKAAYNPQKTECLYYLHDKNRQIHCSKTYEEHKKNIEMYLK